MTCEIQAYTLTSAAGCGLDALRDALWKTRSGLRRNDLAHSDLDTWIGKVAAADEYVWSDQEAVWVCRNNALCAIALEQDGFSERVAAARDRFGPHRVALIMGTSTAGIDRTEFGYRDMDEAGNMPPAFRQPQVHTPHAPTAFVAQRLGLTGPAMTISTACSSSAKVFASAQRWLRSGIADAVVVGGADALCLTVVHGFASLELVSAQPCRPFDRDRDGINIGEAAGFALLTRSTQDADLYLLGCGESSDAHHMSHPHPKGAGAAAAMSEAMRQGEVDPRDVGYVNLHGTASRANDTIEAAVLAQLFDPSCTAASSTKGWTGHALGAAGIVEAVITLEALRAERVPGTMNLVNPDPDLQFPIEQAGRAQAMRFAMTNSFGFGGNNASLVFGRQPT